ncbi:MAG: HAD hydrolase family protein [Candidatus Dormiibacterota bacterium]
MIRTPRESVTPTTTTTGGLADLLNPIPRLLDLLTAAVEGGRWLDAFLLAAGVGQILDDARHPDPGHLRQAGAALRRRGGRAFARTAAGLELVASAVAALGAVRPQTHALDRDRREVADLVSALAGIVMSADAPGRHPATRARLARLAGLPRRLSEPVLQDPLRLPACFRTFDQNPEDLGKLARRVAARWPGRPLLILGVRTSGSYLGPLLGAALTALGETPVATMTIRPGQRWLRSERDGLRRAAAAGAVVLVVDDPPRSWGSVVQAVLAVTAFGFPAARVAIVLQTVPSTAPVPPALADHPRLLLPWHDWAIHRQLTPRAVGDTLRQLLQDRSSVRDVARIPLDGDMAGRRGHVRALYQVDLEEGGVAQRRLVYVKGVGLGYLGQHSAAVAGTLGRFLVPVHGVRDGLLYRDWHPGSRRLTPLEAGPAVAGRIVDYVRARTRALPVARDPVSRLATRGSVPGEVALLLSPLLGRGELLLRPIATTISGRLLRSGRPAVVDGHTALDAWFGDATRPATVRKIGFDERAFSSLDLTCYDPVFDLAGAAASSEVAAFQDRLRDDYEQRTGERVDPERWLLYQLVHLHELQRHVTEPMPEVERRMARRVQRYFEETLIGEVDATDRGPLCAFDLDGVLESSELGFSAASPAAVLAMRSLLCHGYRPVLASGRSLDEVRERCSTYHLPGGVAEYGAALWVQATGRRRVLLDVDELARLDRLRARLARIPRVRVDPAYRCSVRVHIVDADGGRRAVPESLVREALVSADARGIRAVQGRRQTDLVPARVTKATGLKALADELGTPSAPLAMAIGDTVSDLEMLREARLALAPANADAGLRKSGVTVLRHPCQRAVRDAATRLLGHRPGACPVCRTMATDPDTALLLRLLSLVEPGRSGRLLGLVQLWSMTMSAGAGRGRRNVGWTQEG